MTGRAVAAAIAAVVALAIVLPPVAPAVSGGEAERDFRRLDKGLAAFERRDYAAAIGEWRPLALNGDARAQTWIGILHLQGRGVPRDHAKAADWFARAAAQGYGEAAYRLGVMYAFGHGFAEDRARAARHFEAAANLGHVKAQLEMSQRHYLGVGLPFDTVRAYMWASVAEKFAVGGHDLYSAEGSRETMAELMTPAQLAEAQELARAWLARHKRQISRKVAP